MGSVKVKKFKEEKPNLNEVSYAGSNLYYSKDLKKYNPDSLMVRKGNYVYYQMLQDDQIKACLRFKQHAIISRGWYFDVVTDEDGNLNEDHKKISDLFSVIVDRIQGGFKDKLLAILSCIVNGFSICEKVYMPIEYDGSQYWGVKDIKLKNHTTFNGGFEVDPFGNIINIQQVGFGITTEPLPINKLIYMVYQSDIDAQYGESDLRACYRNWWSKEIAIRFLNIFIERMASGFPVATVEGNLSPEQKTNLQNVIKNISSATGIQIPKTVTLDIKSPQHSDMFEQAIQIHDKGIAKSLLVPNLLGITEQGHTGSYSQSQTHFDSFLLIVNFLADLLQEVLNEQLFKELSIWNFGTKDYPKFKFEPLSQAAKESLAKGWGDLIQKGAVTKSESDEKYLRNILGFPEQSIPEEQPVELNNILPQDKNNMPDNQDQQQSEKDKTTKFSEKKPWSKRVNFTETKRELDLSDKTFQEDLSNLMARIRQNIESQISKIAGEKSFGNVSPTEINTITIPKVLLSNIRKSIRNNLQIVLDKGYTEATKELPRRFKNAGMDKTKADKFLASKAMRITDVVDQDTLTEIKQILENAIKYDKTLKQTIASIRDDTKLVALLPEYDADGNAINIPARIETIVRTNNADAWNSARSALFNDPDYKDYIIAFEYSAILDDRISDICDANNGLIRRDWGERTPPNHYNCRSLLIPITTDDNWDGQEDDLPSDGEPQKGFK